MNSHAHNNNEVSIDWRIGIEIELLAPSGKSRLDLAEALSQHYNGSVKRYFHPQTEPSKVEGTPIFHNLTLGYEILDSQKHRIAQCVDDLTLQSDLDSSAEPKPNWYRIVSDDERLLRLIMQQTNPNLPLEDVMKPVANLFGTSPELGNGGMIRVNDQLGASIAIAAPLPGERERPCELITSPMDSDHSKKLDQFLAIVHRLDFKAPIEGATHIHFDATALQSAHFIANIVNLYSTYSDIIKSLVGTNPNCRRLGQWPIELLEIVNVPEFRTLSWQSAQEQLKSLKLTKYCDLNLVNCIHSFSDKNTIEVRMLPVWLESSPILEVASLFIALFEIALKPTPFAIETRLEYTPENAKRFLQFLKLNEHQLNYWHGIVAK